MALSNGPNMGLLTFGLPGEAHYLNLMAQWRGIDFWLNPRVISIALTAPPGSPANGDAYIVPAAATGAWSGHATHVARWTTDLTTPAWEFYIPKSGWGSVFNIADGLNYMFNAAGTAWAVVAGGGGSSAPNVQAVTSAATVTPTFTNDSVKVTAQAVALNLANPTGTAVDMWGMVIRIKDNGTARAITYGTQYRGIGFVLPATTVLGKTLYMSMIWNTEDSKWDVLSYGQE